MTELKKKVREAIRREKQAYDLYRRVLASTTDAARREITARLADDAARHLRIIERVCEQHAASLRTFIQHFVPDIEFAPGDENALIEALRSAVEHKRELLDLYSSLAKAKEAPHWDEMFRELVAAEQEHLKFVQTHLPSVQ